MSTLDRRTFMTLSAGAVAAAPLETALAQTACVTGSLPAFLPGALTVDCASRKNYQVFRKNPDYVGLAGVVSMSFVRGQYGSYVAGNLFLFPWLTKKGVALGTAKDWGVVLPTSDTQYRTTGPMRGNTAPSDEYFLRLVIQAPLAAFIGFQVATPVDSNSARRPWYTNTKLKDGLDVGIAWTSSNLNAPWFGGSRWIPADDTCKGAAWRKLIINGMSLASAGECGVASPGGFSIRRL